MLSQQDQEMWRNVPDPSFTGGSQFCGSGAGNETNIQAVTAVNFEFGARQHLSATWPWSWDSAHHNDVIVALPWLPRVTSQLKMAAVKETNEFHTLFKSMSGRRG